MKDFKELEKITGKTMRLGDFKKIFKDLVNRKLANRLVVESTYLYNEEFEKDGNHYDEIVKEDEDGVVVEWINKKTLIDVVLDDDTKCFVTINFENNINLHNEYIENGNEDKLYITILKVEKRINQN